MNLLLLTCQFLPLAGLLLIALLGNNEKSIAAISFWATHAMGLSILALLVVWAKHGFSGYEFEWFTLYEHGSYRFPILFYLDEVGAAYLFAIWVIFSIIVRYCRNYLHRESGYKRFFLTIFGFAFGLNMVILAGSIDMLFAGWEIVGISSFLLIAFYRHRVQPVRNALRAYTVYRFCDIGLLLGAWMSHLLFHESDHFSQLAVLFEHSAPSPASYPALLLMSLLIFIAASGKSAQFPFCFWLPRAMEGPTPSSAIFYGALSVHLGVFLLLRTTPIWSYHIFTRLIVFCIGLLTVVVASISEKTQANIKGQIAYSSITQVGIMFMELAAGLETLVLFHFLGNAFLRCYQLLVSPSIVAHMLRVEGAIDTEMGFNTQNMQNYLPVSIRDTLPEVLQNTLYVFALQEGNLERLVRSVLWTPLKRIGATINACKIWEKLLVGGSVFAVFGSLIHFGLMAAHFMAIPVALMMVLASLSAFSQKHSFVWVWNAIAMSCLLAAVAVWLLQPTARIDILLFMTGIVPSWLLGLLVLSKLPGKEQFADSPFAYRAMAETYPGLAMLLFLSFLGLVGFPITPAFIGEDLLLYHASTQHAWIAALIAISFVINGIAGARVFLRLCMGRPTEICDHAEITALQVILQSHK
ncbi:MAG: proton-conducting transporter membrane subunit [Methylovulum sp.]|uniref:proton-conducting transporter transmembrane domain-containing protein n=1 Tax=Methylovulum sp. TaxID=1916980 RepID=UPI00260ABD5B|nr:proton-conducting transporter membrane subunit [Methylovulum sp.]MDD2724030.1 proton-conducting transporter membrane subunit [Methylovulum sp.]